LEPVSCYHIDRSRQWREQLDNIADIIHVSLH